MELTLKLDEAGRLALPEAVREELHLYPGDSVEVSIDGEHVILRPRRTSSRLTKERGVWVLRTGEPLDETTTRKVLEEIRDQR